MSCFHPLEGWRNAKSGKLQLSPAGAFDAVTVRVSCGQCHGCQLERARQWAVRCVKEASLYDENCMLTLTYDDEHLPPGGSLRLRDFQLFMKRLRKRYPYGLGNVRAPRRIRFYHCGEYGATFERPHYHVLLFGFEFPDACRVGTRGGYPVYRSKVLEELWSVGFSEIGTVTFESAAYVARYLLKKLYDDDPYALVDLDTGVITDREPPHSTMSRGRRPDGGIGFRWFEKYKSEVFPADGVIVGGKLVPPPRYYDNLYEIVDPGAALEVARKRKRRLLPRERTSRARAARKALTLARLGQLPERGI